MSLLGVVGCLFHIITTQPAQDGDDGGEDEPDEETERDGGRARVHYVASLEESGTARRGGGDGAEVGQIRLQLFHSALSQSLVFLALSSSSKHEDATQPRSTKKNFNFQTS